MCLNHEINRLGLSSSINKIPLKAIQFHEYGSPDVLSYEDTDPPEIEPTDLLIDVHAAGVNPVDWRYRKGQLKWYDWFSSFPRRPGCDFAGKVIETGDAVSKFENGQRVYGMTGPLESGTYAEQIAVPAEYVAEIPKKLSMVEAAGLPLVCLTSLQALRDKARIQNGEKILINGASGGVGIAAVQM
ncbi:MAG: NADP-dependent oxidoreductase, partial [bacterium]